MPECALTDQYGPARTALPSMLLISAGYRLTGWTSERRCRSLYTEFCKGRRLSPRRRQKRNEANRSETIFEADPPQIQTEGEVGRREAESERVVDRKFLDWLCGTGLYPGIAGHSASLLSRGSRSGGITVHRSACASKGLSNEADYPLCRNLHMEQNRDMVGGWKAFEDKYGFSRAEQVQLR